MEELLPIIAILDIEYPGIYAMLTGLTIPPAARGITGFPGCDSAAEGCTGLGV